MMDGEIPKGSFKGDRVRFGVFSLTFKCINQKISLAERNTENPISLQSLSLAYVELVLYFKNHLSTNFSKLSLLDFITGVNYIFE